MIPDQFLERLAWGMWLCVPQFPLPWGGDGTLHRGFIPGVSSPHPRASRLPSLTCTRDVHGARQPCHHQSPPLVEIIKLHPHPPRL